MSATTKDITIRTRAEIDDARLQLQRELDSLASQEKQQAKDDFAERRRAFLDSAPELRQKRDSARKHWEDMIEIRRKPERDELEAEKSFHSAEGQIRQQLRALSLCPCCWEADWNHSNLIAECSRCGHRARDVNPDILRFPGDLPRKPAPPTSTALPTLSAEGATTLTAGEFCTLLGVSRPTFNDMRKAGKIPAATGLSRGRLLWSRDTVRVWIDSNLNL